MCIRDRVKTSRIAAPVFGRRSVGHPVVGSRCSSCTMMSRVKTAVVGGDGCERGVDHGREATRCSRQLTTHDQLPGGSPWPAWSSISTLTPVVATAPTVLSKARESRGGIIQGRKEHNTSPEHEQGGESHGLVRPPLRLRLRRAHAVVERGSARVVEGEGRQRTITPGARKSAVVCTREREERDDERKHIASII